MFWNDGDTVAGSNGTAGDVSASVGSHDTTSGGGGGGNGSFESPVYSRDGATVGTIEDSFDAAEGRGGSVATSGGGDHDEFVQAQSHWESRLGSFTEPHDRDDFELRRGGVGVGVEVPLAESDSDSDDSESESESDMDLKDPNARRRRRRRRRREGEKAAAATTLWDRCCRRRMVTPVLIACAIALVIVALLVLTPRYDKRRDAATTTTQAVVSSASATTDDDDVGDGGGSIQADAVGASLGLVDAVANETDAVAPATASFSSPPSATAAPTSAPTVSPTVSPTSAPSTTPSAAPSPIPRPEWSLAAELSHEAASTGTDVSLAAEGRRLAVGAPGEGRVRLHDRDPTSGGWSNVATTELGEGSSTYSRFGASVSLSADGESVAVRALRPGLLVGGVHALVFRHDSETNEWAFDPSLFLALSNTAGSAYDESQSAMAYAGAGNTLALASTAIDSETHDQHEEDLSQIILAHDHKLYSIYLLSTIHHSDHYVSLSHDGNRVAFTDDERVFVKEFHFRSALVQYWTFVGAVLEGDDDDVDYGSTVVLSPCGEYLAVSSVGNTKVYVAPPHAVDDRSVTSNSTETPWTLVGDVVRSDAVRPASVALRSQRMTLVDDDANANANANTTTTTTTNTLLTLALSYSGADGAGVVRVLQFNTGGSVVWQPKGNEEELAAYSLSEDRHLRGFGSSVSVSQDGQTVAVGAPATGTDEIDDESRDGGKVLVYELGG